MCVCDLNNLHFQSISEFDTIPNGNSIVSTLSLADGTRGKKRGVAAGKLTRIYQSIWGFDMRRTWYIWLCSIFQGYSRIIPGICFTNKVMILSILMHTFLDESVSGWGSHFLKFYRILYSNGMWQVHIIVVHGICLDYSQLDCLIAAKKVCCQWCNPIVILLQDESQAFICALTYHVTGTS